MFLGLIVIALCCLFWVSVIVVVLGWWILWFTLLAGSVDGVGCLVVVLRVFVVVCCGIAWSFRFSMYCWFSDSWCFVYCLLGVLGLCFDLLYCGGLACVCGFGGCCVGLLWLVDYVLFSVVSC